MRIVDSHAHVWPRGLIHPAQHRQEPMQASPADLVAELDASGVAAVIVSPAMIHPDNGYVLAAMTQFPERIMAVVGIDPRSTSAVETIPRLARAGAIGVRVSPASIPPDGPRELAGLDALTDAVVDAGLVMQWTIRLPSTGLVERAAARAPAARQVVDHLVLPPDATRLDDLGRVRDLAAIPGLHVKLSGMYALSNEGYPYKDTWTWAEGAVDAFGPERTMWASDWPLAGESATYADHLGLVDSLPFLDEPSRRWILQATAARFWGVPQAPEGRA